MSDNALGGLVLAVLIAAVTATAAAILSAADAVTSLILVGATWAIAAILIGYLTGAMEGDHE